MRQADKFDSPFWALTLLQMQVMENVIRELEGHGKEFTVFFNTITITSLRWFVLMMLLQKELSGIPR